MRRHKGFTLIELMIAMAIVAILAAVAYPMFTKSALKGRRADGKAMLNQVSQALERCYTQFGTYNNTNCTEYTSVNGANLTSAKGYYNVTLVTANSSGTTYQVSATAVTTGPQANDTGCTVFYLNSAGRQTSGTSGSTTDTNSCW